MARRKTLRTSHKIRLVDNDPDYERITGIRDAKEKRFGAKILACIGLVFLIPSSPFVVDYRDAVLPFAVGLLFEALAGGYLLAALSIESRFR